TSQAYSAANGTDGIRSAERSPAAKRSTSAGITPGIKKNTSASAAIVSSCIPVARRSEVYAPKDQASNARAVSNARNVNRLALMVAMMWATNTTGRNPRAGCDGAAIARQMAGGRFTAVDAITTVHTAAARRAAASVRGRTGRLPTIS